jgi:RNA polymerase sigma-70 factor (ECF subfamily)
MAGSGTDTTADAADLTQDVFVKAWLHLGATRPETKIGAWLYRIATNVCLDELRHRKLVVLQSWDAYLTAFHPSQVARAEEQPEQRLEAAEDAAEVRAVLAAMPARYARLLALREFRDLQYFELAAVTGQSWAATKSMLFRARDRFAHTGAAMGLRPFGRDLAEAPKRRLGGLRGAGR